MLGRIWNLADTHQRGELGLTEFMIAMHLVASHRNGTLRALPQSLPAGLYEAASRRGGPRPLMGSRPSSGIASISPVNRQFSGSGFSSASSPGIKPLHQQPQPSPGDEWAIGTRDKESFDQIFSTLDTEDRGFITGDQAVGFFGNARLPEEVLAQIWDLADINSEGRLNRDEFAVAMFLIRQERTKRDARDVLPPTLPPNLVPPSMRRAPLALSVPTAPSSDPAPAITAQKSAADDLVGLDTFTTSAPQGPLTTGTLPSHSSPSFPVQGSRPLRHEPQPPSSVKPFVPSLSFNQAMMAPPSNASSQATGFPTSDRQVHIESLQQRPAMDDLLGDNDPEISKKLTQETADLANLSNQVSNLTSQMQQVKAKRVSTEQDLSKAQSQKRDFEVRLTQLRSAYEQENVVVKALGERLLVSRNELRILEQDMAQIDGTHQDLQAQHRELAAALEADKRENATIKERIRQSNIEINLLRPQLEKLKSDARQQKGLVAINKKQLATNEIEREKVKREVEGASKELEEATREAEESRRKLQAGPEAGRSTTPVPDSTTNRSSPTTTMNPFLRRPPTEPFEQGRSSPFNAQTLASPNHTAFDNFFGPSPTTYPQAGPPPTSFTVGSPTISDEQLPSATVAAESPKGQRTTSSPDSVLTAADIEMPQVPPAPPRSRQITSSFLPLRNLQRSDSTSSSVMVAPPGSRGGGASGSNTPIDQRPPESGSLRQLDLKQKIERRELQSQDDDLQSSLYKADEKSSSEGQKGVDQDQSMDKDEGEVFAQPSTTMEVPGAFPGDATVQPSAQSSRSNSSRSLEDLVTPSATKPSNSSVRGLDLERTSSVPRDEFNAAFEGFGNKGKGIAKTNGNTPHDIGRTGSFKTQGEFPPIEEIGSNEDSDSESDYGFDDNFTTTSPQRLPKVSETPSQLSKIPDPSSEERDLSPARLPIAAEGSDQTQLPLPGAESSSARNNQTVTPHGRSGEQDIPLFPAEYTDLLPSQDAMSSYPPFEEEKATSKTISSLSKEGEGLGLFADKRAGESAHDFNFAPAESSTTSAPLFAPYPPDQSPSKQVQPQPVVPPKTALTDDFEKEFGDLAEAKEADDKGDDEVILVGKDAFDDFNPVFDSPTPSRTTVNPPSTSIPTDNGFRDFESSIAGNGASTGSQQATSQPTSNSNHDWDAIFAGLDNSASKNAEPASQSASRSLTTQPQPQPPSSSEAKKPALNRGLSTGTEHDDPILKRLTVMGYPRDASLSALEKFDYNIDKVSLAPK